jgi:hypothetical protein
MYSSSFVRPLNSMAHAAPVTKVALVRTNSAGLTLSQLEGHGFSSSPLDMGGGQLQRQGHTEENDVLIDFLRNDLAKWQSMEAVHVSPPTHPQF